MSVGYSPSNLIGMGGGQNSTMGFTPLQIARMPGPISPYEYKNIKEGLAYTIENYKAVADAYPDKQIVITEAGWATKSNGRGIEPSNVNESFQRQYFYELMEWAEKEKVLVYYFEAFDENWKGSDDPLEPEKHWGLYKTNRRPKQAMYRPIRRAV